MRADGRCSVCWSVLNSDPPFQSRALSIVGICDAMLQRRPCRHQTPGVVESSRINQCLETEITKPTKILVGFFVGFVFRDERWRYGDLRRRLIGVKMRRAKTALPARRYRLWKREGYERLTRNRRDKTAGCRSDSLSDPTASGSPGSPSTDDPTDLLFTHSRGPLPPLDAGARASVEGEPGSQMLSGPISYQIGNQQFIATISGQALVAFALPRDRYRRAVRLFSRDAFSRRSVDV